MTRAEKVNRRLSRSAVLVGLAVAVSLSASSRAQTQEKTAEQVYKNIQVLTGLPASELDGVMSFMSASLGVGCAHCHTNPWDSDVKSPKLAARRMILMTRAINKENFSGNPAITCYTCHHGQPGTVPNPPADLAAVQHSDTAATSATAHALPSTEEIIDRYVRAIGGEAAIEKITTLVSRGTETTTNRMTPPLTLPIEIYQTGQNKMLITRNTPRGAVLEGFNGTAGWFKDDRGQAALSDKRLTDIKRDADSFCYLRIKQTYPQMRVLGKEKVGEREAYVVGATSREDSRDKLYFDVNTDLLIRKYVAFKTAFGTIPEITEFDDYREVSRVKLPFKITWSRPPFSSMRQFAEIRLNSIIDDSKFERRAR